MKIKRHYVGGKLASLFVNLHTDVLFTPGGIFISDIPSDGQGKVKSLIESILAVNGVQGVIINRYILNIERTLAVEWSAILPKIEDIVIKATANFPSIK